MHRAAASCIQMWPLLRSQQTMAASFLKKIFKKNPKHTNWTWEALGIFAVRWTPYVFLSVTQHLKTVANIRILLPENINLERNYRPKADLCKHDGSFEAQNFMSRKMTITHRLICTSKAMPVSRSRGWCSMRTIVSIKVTLMRRRTANTNWRN